MSILARKITLQKWTRQGNQRYQRVPLDGITYDLRTTNHTLSLWVCEPDQQQSIDEVALVLAASRERIDRLDIAFLKESDLREREIKIEETVGNTTVAHLKSRHRDAAELSLERFCAFARLTNTAIRNGDCCRISRQQILQILVEAVRNNVVDLSDLQDKVRHDVNSHVASLAR